MEITAQTIKELRPNLEVIDVSDWDHGQWLAYRKDGIGCSEVGAMLDHNEYLEPIVLFNQKSGMTSYGTEDNNAMFMAEFRRLNDDNRHKEEIDNLYPILIKSSSRRKAGLTRFAHTLYFQSLLIGHALINNRKTIIGG